MTTWNATTSMGRGRDTLPLHPIPKTNLAVYTKVLTHPLTGRKSIASSRARIRSLFRPAKFSLFDEEACLQQAYEAMLKASLGFMFSHGFRARSQPGHHIAIIDFVRSRIDKKHAGLLVVFDRLRRKSNTALYDDTGFVSRHDAEQALESAVDYLNVIRADIADRKP